MANLAKNQESLERIVEEKMNNLDIKVIEIQSIVEKLRDNDEDSDAHGGGGRRHDCGHWLVGAVVANGAGNRSGFVRKVRG